MLNKLGNSKTVQEDASLRDATKALPSGQDDPEATQATATTQPAERCNWEENDCAKRE
jgi:hypothetical protein